MKTDNWISRLILAVSLTGGLGLAHGDARAQAYPAKPVTLVVGYGPGTGIDIVARIVGKKVSETWTSIVIENRPGATGGISMEMTANARPDGYNAVMASGSQIINQHVSKVRYDLERDFAPVSMMATQAIAVAVGSLSPVKSMKDLIDLAKSSPGKVSYAASTGSVFHLMGEMFMTSQGINITRVPYKSTTDAVTDLVSGRIEVLLTQLPTALPLAKAGKLRILALTGDRRSTLLPDVPTMSEAGLPNLADVQSTLFLLVPKATPELLVDALNREIVSALSTQEVRERLTAAGFEPTSSTPQELSALISRESARWGKIVKDAGIRLE